MENETKEPTTFATEKLVDIKKSENEVIRIAKSEYRGSRYIDIRIFFETKEGGEYRPTRKGIAIKEDIFGVFAEAVRSAELLLNQSV